MGFKLKDVGFVKRFQNWGSKNRELSLPLDFPLNGIVLGGQPLTFNNEYLTIGVNNG